MIQGVPTPDGVIQRVITRLWREFSQTEFVHGELAALAVARAPMSAGSLRLVIAVRSEFAVCWWLRRDKHCDLAEGGPSGRLLDTAGEQPERRRPASKLARSAIRATKSPDRLEGACRSSACAEARCRWDHRRRVWGRSPATVPVAASTSPVCRPVQRRTWRCAGLARNRNAAMPPAARPGATLERPRAVFSSNSWARWSHMTLGDGSSPRPVRAQSRRRRPVMTRSRQARDVPAVWFAACIARGRP